MPRAATSRTVRSPRRQRNGVVVALVLLASVSAACGSDGDATGADAPTVLIALDDSSPGDVVALVASESSSDNTTAPRYVEWLDRTGGTIYRLDIDDPDAEPEWLATVAVGIDGEQRGLLGQVVIDGRRFAAWTQPDTFELVVGEIADGGAGAIVWSAGPTAGGAIGGQLDQVDGMIVLGLGRNTGWDADTGVGGAMLLIDPDGSADQVATSISIGYTNPWAFTVTDAGEIWVADNAAGPAPDDESADDLERTGRADVVTDRNDMSRSTLAPRAPSAMVELPDGRIGICGFLDNELRAYEIVDGGEADPTNPATIDVPRSELSRAGTIMPCLTGAAVFSDGTIVTAAQTDAGESLLVLRP